ncbi:MULTISPECIES: hypothetical protein [Nostocales]|uniref:Uncharacterized protein n=3 Tax=Nostocales TaxID=1161 RepID=A0A0C1NBN5_9CYAN|nr:hypothetical protein [Tolypothrix bouteillei]KAF3885953.1 hypothetical protein DA73_0400011090 [Tolypothrix bouteillei VB521301]
MTEQNPHRGGDRREGGKRFLPEQPLTATEVATFVEQFQAATTDKEKLLVVSSLLDAVAKDYLDSPEHQESGKAIHSAFSRLAYLIKENGSLKSA